MGERYLITGITGFVGSHLAELLLNKGKEVYGLYRWRSSTDNVAHLKDRITLLEGDLTDAYSLENLLKECKPHYIFHLAAQSFVPMSWKAPIDTFNINVVGQINLFEAVRNVGLNPGIQIACSSEEYGLVKPNETPITEENELRPLSPYGVSKVAQDYLGYQYFKSYGLKVVRTRGFNHTGPRRGEVFVESNFAKQIALIESGEQEPIIYVGNLNAKRDYTDVRDMVRGYYLAIKKGKPGEVYNVCSGKAHSIRKVLDTLLSLANVKVKVKQDKSRMRPSDVPLLLGSYKKFSKQTGWKPTIPFEKTMQDLLDYWREKV